MYRGSYSLLRSEDSVFDRRTNNPANGSLFAIRVTTLRTILSV